MKLKCCLFKPLWLLLPMLVVVLDQASKIMALKQLQLLTPVAVFPGFNLTLIYNLGAAFSFLDSPMGWQRWVLSGIAILVCLFILIWFFRIKGQQVVLRIALMLILGGAIGNLIDRICYGYVIDFLDVYYRHWHWYTFNLADAAISLGAGLLILDAVFESDRTHLGVSDEKNTPVEGPKS